MKIVLDDILSEKVTKLASELGISNLELLTNAINSYINMHQLKKQRRFEAVIVEDDERRGDITSWFFKKKNPFETAKNGKKKPHTQNGDHTGSTN